MPKIKFIQPAVVVMMSCVLSAYAQSDNRWHKLAEKAELAKIPYEKFEVHNYTPQRLAEIIDTTARNMKYSVYPIEATQTKFLLTRTFGHFEFHYALLLQIALADSDSSYLFVQGFWFLPPDSIPPPDKSMVRAARDHAKLFLCALVQEIAKFYEDSNFVHEINPSHDPQRHKLPDKSFKKFVGLNLVNPGLASWHMAKDDPRVSRKSAIARSIVLGVLDLGYLALALTPDRDRDGCPCLDQTDHDLTKFSNRQLGGIFGMLSSRAMMTGYFGDQVYHDLRKSGYDFPKINDLNFNNYPYTKYIKHKEIK